MAVVLAVLVSALRAAHAEHVAATTTQVAEVADSSPRTIATRAQSTSTLERAVAASPTAKPPLPAASTPEAYSPPVAKKSAEPSLPDGVHDPVAPYFSLRRPFGDGAETRASRYYPYGTAAHGAYMLHHGADIGNLEGTPVLAVADGRVVFAGHDDVQRWGPRTDFYGTLVVLQHDQEAEGQPIATLYGHLSRTLVETGDEVEAGEVVGAVGSTGVALGPHLHFEVRLDPRDYGSTRNPELFLELLDGTGAIVGRLAAPGGSDVYGESVTLYSSAAGEPGTWMGETTTYLPGPVNASPLWGESFLFGDLAPGSYVVAAGAGDIAVSREVTVEAGKVTVVTLELPTLSSSCGQGGGNGRLEGCPEAAETR
jgi:murein DD-endopeptidase MepM/ murein hydrolase activator NlpD